MREVRGDHVGTANGKTFARLGGELSQVSLDEDFTWAGRDDGMSYSMARDELYLKKLNKFI